MDSFEQINIDQAKEMIDKQNVLVIDIRDSGDFKEAHIPNAVLVDDTNVEGFIAKSDKNKPLICYCYHGISSQSAAAYFKQSGFAQVYSIIGGFEKWRQVNPVSN